MPNKTNTTTNTGNAAPGEDPANQNPQATKTSSTTLAMIFENGSGEVLMRSRIPALVPCANNDAETASTATPAPAIAPADGASAPSASSAPPAGLMKVWIESHSESAHGTLSTRNSTRKSTSATPITAGCAKPSSAAVSAKAGHSRRTASPTMKAVR